MKTTVAGIEIEIAPTCFGRFRRVKHAQYAARRVDDGTLLASACETEEQALRCAAMAITGLPACELGRVL